MSMPSETSLETPPAEMKQGWRRYAPLAALALLAGGAIYAFGDALSFETLVENRAALIEWRDSNFALAAVVFAAIYTAAVALSVPGALWLTLAGGFLFGTVVGAPLIVAAATLGATIIFVVARTSLGEGLRSAAGPWLAKLQDGFSRDAASYLLMLRLVPVVPFFVANLAPAFLGVRTSTFVWTTALGIIPGTVVYTSVGAGLGAVIEAGGEPQLDIIFQPAVLGPLLGLAALSALPILIRRFRGAPSDDAEATSRKEDAS